MTMATSLSATLFLLITVEVRCTLLSLPLLTIYRPRSIPRYPHYRRPPKIVNVFMVSAEMEAFAE
jgi:hypothetical protein